MEPAKISIAARLPEHQPSLRGTILAWLPAPEAGAVAPRQPAFLVRLEGASAVGGSPLHAVLGAPLPAQAGLPRQASAAVARCPSELGNGTANADSHSPFRAPGTTPPSPRWKSLGPVGAVSERTVAPRLAALARPVAQQCFSVCPLKSPSPLDSDMTTAMVRHIPDTVSQDRFMAEVDEAGFEGLYDFLHVRTDLRSRHTAGRGVAFVNFLTPQVASDFYKAFQGRRPLGWHDPSSASLEVLPAKIQGFVANAVQHIPDGLCRGGPRRNRPTFLPKTREARLQLMALQRAAEGAPGTSQLAGAAECGRADAGQAGGSPAEGQVPARGCSRASRVQRHRYFTAAAKRSSHS
ncbi:unnamed protein product [Prorocentrum cordatum]|uniref:Mei2-like C-terminal RNA recognition motif domain-containing protein n=1 Tax=Prorocentrum cordatum TaxID=2364126 RepID=A0ABN9PYM2_9DINO|nr:unnamed protein product [Polarella glacialis]